MKGCGNKDPRKGKWAVTAMIGLLIIVGIIIFFFMVGSEQTGKDRGISKESSVSETEKKKSSSDGKGKMLISGIIEKLSLSEIKKETSAEETTWETSVPETMEETVAAETADAVSVPGMKPKEETIWNPEQDSTLSFEMIRLDNGDSSWNGTNHHNAMVYCEYPVFSGEGAVDVINADMLRIAEAFAYCYTRAEIEEEHYAFGMPYAYSHTGFLEPAYHGNGILSIKLDYGGFWGEDNTYEGGLVGYVYNMSTGERLTLMELTGLSAEELLQILKAETESLVKNYIERRGSGLHKAILVITDKSLVHLDDLTLEDFSFYVKEDGMIEVTINGIHMRKEEGDRGYWVAFEFPIGYGIS